LVLRPEEDAERAKLRVRCKVFSAHCDSTQQFANYRVLDPVFGDLKRDVQRSGDWYGGNRFNFHILTSTGLFGFFRVFAGLAVHRAASLARACSTGGGFFTEVSA
jgi:hypothetical protein